MHRSSSSARRKRRGRPVGIYPETKHPTYHRTSGSRSRAGWSRALRRAGLDRRRAPVFIQSFEQSNLKRLNRMIDVRLIQLVDANDVNPDGTLDYTAPFDRPYDWTVSGNPVLTSRTFGFFATDAGLDEIRTYADGIGPWKRYIVSTRRSTPTVTASSATRTATATRRGRPQAARRRPT